MSAEELTQEERDLARKILSGSTMSLFADPGFERHLLDRVALGIGGMPITQIGGGRGIARFLATDIVETEITATTNTSFFTYKLPAKTIALGGELRIFIAFTSRTPDASNTLRLSLLFGGVERWNQDLDQTLMDTNHRAGWIELRIVNLGVYNSQAVFSHGGYGFQLGADHEIATYISGTLAISSTDTSAETTLDLRARWFNAGDQSFKQKYVSLQVFNPIGFE